MPKAQTPQPVPVAPWRKLQMRLAENHRAFPTSGRREGPRMRLVATRNPQALPVAGLLGGRRPVRGTFGSMKSAGSPLREDQAMGLGTRQNLPPAFPTKAHWVSRFPGADAHEPGLRRKQAFSPSARRVAGGCRAAVLRKDLVPWGIRAFVPPEEQVAGESRAVHPPEIEVAVGLLGAPVWDRPIQTTPPADPPPP